MTTTKQGSKSKRSPTTDRRTKRIAELLNSGSELDLDALDQEGREIVETIARLGRKSNSGDSVYRSALEGSATACVHVDRDLVVTYVNPATVRLIAAVREDLEKAFPKADFDNLLGTCIDNFHLKPEVQRRLLDDPRNLPHKAEIKIGRLRIELNITALHDSNGEYLGARLEWYDVTDVRAKEAENAAYEAQVRAINRSLAVIEFEMDGTIRTANQNFLTAMGYTLEEVKGRHHSIFVDAQEAAGAGYREFWEKLNRGEFASSMYRRFGKGNREVWIQATYNPSIGADGKPFRVIKYATDVTAAQMKNADYEGQIAAIGKSQAVIEFEMD
ncbi:MAG: PAS domain-containing protein, partial [Planctomycetes bacterium]|nr:PAS domain-containing protein [Planctomycetota bacterium]